MLRDTFFQVKDGDILTWILQGQPGRNAGLTLRLQVRFTEVEKGSKKVGGVWFDTVGSDIPDGVAFGGREGAEYVLSKGRMVYVENHNGASLTFEDDHYTLLNPSKVEPGTGGTLYFHCFVPRELGGDGEIVYTRDQFLE